MLYAGRRARKRNALADVRYAEVRPRYGDELRQDRYAERLYLRLAFRFPRERRTPNRSTTGGIKPVMPHDVLLLKAIAP